MAEYIDKQQVIETVAYYREDPDGIDHALESIENIPSADVQPAKWIHVTERLPDIGEKVITYCKGYGVKENFRSGDGTWWVGFKITHWMPLPELPKDGETDG